ncbi:phosphopantetheine-binding protein [Desulfonema magnum]|uniref:Phosphopantetheine binding ACP domain-containing protein n=1 Tax=Desulfonema magnum TaxID=45655 RepID=A0A975BJ55_9BACT|nr:phosphopantetheine-binding protein [Desulfonema magnum]QTA86286.1 Phosphopantetheine binding ACP domain-containing protein [Desulfonema magnum]
MEIQETLWNYIINETLGGRLPEGFDGDYDLIDSGTLDSFKMMNLIIYFEQHYQVEFGINDIVPKHFKSVNALVAFLRNKLG